MAIEHAVTPVDLTSGDDLRRHFARELHDQVAQPLIGLVLDMHNLRGAPDVPDAVVAELTRFEESARGVLRQAREMMVDLRDRGDLRVNLSQALKQQIPIPSGHDLTLQASSRWPRRINGWAAFNLLRIVQQAVANAWTHGHANRIDVLLDISPAGEALIVILDDGVGIQDAPGGFGMLGMQERAAILGGTFSARPRETGGTRVEVRFPVARLA